MDVDEVSFLHDEVATRILSESRHDRHHEETLKNHIRDTLEIMEKIPLCSSPSLLQTLRKANGRHTVY